MHRSRAARRLSLRGDKECLKLAIAIKRVGIDRLNRLRPIFAPGHFGYKVEMHEARLSDVLLKQAEDELLRLTCGGLPLLQSDNLTQAGILVQGRSGRGQPSA